MTYVPRILAFAGALRRDSLNKKTVLIAAKAAEKAGAAGKLQDLMLAHDGFLISSPEYNSGISGTLKTYIDWTSRPCGELRRKCRTGCQPVQRQGGAA